MSKFKRIYEDEDTLETWGFDLGVFKNGPISVEIEYKYDLKKRAKEIKQQKKIDREMKKINKRNQNK